MCVSEQHGKPGTHIIASYTMLLSSSEAEQEQLRTSKSDPLGLSMIHNWRARVGLYASMWLLLAGWGEKNAKRSRPSGKNPNPFPWRPATTTRLLIALHPPPAALASSTPPLALSSSSKQEVPVRTAIAGGPPLQDLPSSI
jgi:hypothetical protein